jgi:hypothetical protein
VRCLALCTTLLLLSGPGIVSLTSVWRRLFFLDLILVVLVALLHYDTTTLTRLRRRLCGGQWTQKRANGPGVYADDRFLWSRQIV